ncbi:hypothetical protein KFL_000240310 [Klebsormidium nitens]|uniref:Uncharacterized protein n=1 Tax=Klebsormidium nitens TaxID=105231 RepID=A0A1Y1HKI2_KLENI|nr:hypothetical protein KFL_000240310 [Klebsormidium nitens]|eukprot:GAQ79100.1 hypothetical protein KFL_000240310 [Klebsormidium nitens]
MHLHHALQGFATRRLVSGMAAPGVDEKGPFTEKDLEAAAADVTTITSNNKTNKEAVIRLQAARARIDSVIGANKPPFWDQVATHKVLIVTAFLTIVGMAGSALGLVAGYAAEKDRAAIVLAGALLSLVGNFVSSATGIFVTPPTLGKKP